MQRDRSARRHVQRIETRGHRDADPAAPAHHGFRQARPFGPDEAAAVHAVVLKAYRWQYIVSGAQEPRFQQVLKALVTPAQMQRILHALAPFFADA